MLRCSVRVSFCVVFIRYLHAVSGPAVGIQPKQAVALPVTIILWLSILHTHDGIVSSK